LLLSAIAGVGGRPPDPLLLADLLAIGAGFGLTIPNLAASMLSAAPPNHESAVSGLMLTVQQGAGAVGVAASGALLTPPLPAGQAVSLGMGLVVNAGLFLIAAA